MKRVLILILLLAWPCALVHAQQGEILLVAPTNHEMPLALFEGGNLSAGIIKDIGDAIGKRMGRRPRYLIVPSKRVISVLESGEADGICYVRPEWIGADYHWTVGFIPNAEVVIARIDAKVLHDIKDLEGKPLGTILGYHYPEITEVLSTHILRDDAQNTEQNFRKFLAGRTQYAVIDKATLEHKLKLDKSIQLRVDLELPTYKAGCAFSNKSRIPFQQIDDAVNSLIKDGSIDHILAQYRPASAHQ